MSSRWQPHRRSLPIASRNRPEDQRNLPDYGNPNVLVSSRPVVANVLLIGDGKFPRM